MTRRRISIVIGTAVAAAGLGAGVAAAVSGGSGGTSHRRTAAAAVTAAPPYSYYQSMMSRYYGGAGSMMGGSSGWMMDTGGYRWMFGTAIAPAWMRGARLPAAMMSTAADMGQVMGRMWAGAPGPRVGISKAAELGSQVPADAAVSKAANTITFTTSTVGFAAVASPAGGPDETFRIAGLVNPKVIVPAGTRVTIQVVNADPDTAHGLVITSAADSAASWMPMMTGRPAFANSALWFLGNPTATGMHTGTLTFIATTPGTYQYLCPVPGHAQKGMSCSFTVTSVR